MKTLPAKLWLFGKAAIHHVYSPVLGTNVLFLEAFKVRLDRALSYLI